MQYLFRRFVLTSASLLLLGLPAIAQTPPVIPAPAQQPAPEPAPIAQPAPAPSAAPVSAAKTGPVVVGIVDIQALIQQSTAGKSLSSQSDQKRKAVQAEITKQEQAIRAQQQQLLAQRASLPAADFEKKEADLKAAFTKLAGDTDVKRKAFEESYAKALQQIYTVLSKVLSDVALQRGMNLVLNKSNVVLSDERWDITAEALKRLNATLTSVKMQ